MSTVMVFAGIILIFQVISGIIEFFNAKPTDDIKSKGWYYFSKVLLVLAVVFSGILLSLSNDENNIKEQQESTFKIELKNKLDSQAREHSKEDSILTAHCMDRVDSSYAKSIIASNKALAEYNLSLVDSMRVIIPNGSRLTPVINLAPAAIDRPNVYISKQGTATFLNIKLEAKDATAYNIKVRTYFLPCESSNTPDAGFTYFEQIDYTADGSYANFPTGIERTPSIALTPNLWNRRCEIIYTMGQYSADLNNKVIIPFELAFRYNIVENKFISGIDPKAAKIIKNVIKKLNRNQKLF